MKIKFGNIKPTTLQNWEIYSPNQRVHIKTKYWQNYDIAEAYAKNLHIAHGGAFSVRWAKPYPTRPIRIIKEKG